MKDPFLIRRHRKAALSFIREISSIWGLSWGAISKPTPVQPLLRSLVLAPRLCRDPTGYRIRIKLKYQNEFIDTN